MNNTGTDNLEVAKNGAGGRHHEEQPVRERDASARSPDPFDPARLTLSQDFGAAVGVKKILTTVPVRKPNRHEFVMVRDDAAFHLQTAALTFKEERDEVFIVERGLWSELGEHLQPILLCTTINRQGVLSLWPIKLPGAEGRTNSWNVSAMDAATRAMKRWVRISANMSLGAYELYEATGELAPPAWPDLSLADIIKVAFRENFIRDMNHIVVKKLRGEV